MERFNKKGRIYAYSVDDYLKFFREGYWDIRFRGDLDALLKVLKVEGETDIDFRYAYICRLMDAGQDDLAFSLLLGLEEEHPQYLRVKMGISYCYLNGRGVEKDAKKGLEILLAMKDDVDCPRGVFLNLGYCYRTGEGVEPDLKVALHYYETALELGVASAALSAIKTLQAMEEKLNIPYDEKTAFAYALKGAKLGSLNAMEEVAIRYRDGLGCEEDPVAYEAWDKRCKELDDGPVDPDATIDLKIANWFD